MLAALVAAFSIVALVAAGPADARRKADDAEPSAPSQADDLFGSPAVAYPPAINFAKWTGVLARYESERRLEAALCREGDCALRRWRGFLASLRRLGPMAQLSAVNAYINKFPYVADTENYGVDDYWATPRELFARGGDCEDYAIAKYLSLRALGWPADRLRIVVVYDRERDLVHAVLVAYHDSGAYLLDIEIATVTDHRRVTRYLPIFAIGETGWWSYNPVPVAAGDATATADDPVVGETIPAPGAPVEDPPAAGAD